MEPRSIMSLGIAVNSVKQYSYRTAMVADAPIVLDRRQEFVKKFEEELLKEVQFSSDTPVRIDNHTVYEITTCDGNMLYVMCSDFKMYVGTNLRKERW